ncbi:hypothetical protein DMC30DRAFT_414066 [Rhodotorula diobovata]|uniref:Proteophosphoglycan ppg4 n=1 Tax=Rhodotorula diobovata TaxID=5288 RepID=A0A5C5G325_9BASI|nr:hypothetical protein DMC30DRAFT_414066 [Rhodotorula diobovata]
MALRRPPTAVSLQPSDVADLQASIAQRNAAASSAPVSTTADAGASSGTKVGDALIEREKQEQREREARGARGRVVGGGAARRSRQLPVSQPARFSPNRATERFVGALPEDLGASVLSPVPRHLSPSPLSRDAPPPPAQLDACIHVDDMREDLEGIVNRVDRLKRDLGLADPWTYAPDEDPPDYEDDYDVADWSRQRDQYEQASELVALRGFAHHYLAELSPATPPATGVANSDKSKRRRVDNRPTKRRVESLTRTGHFEAARSALDRLYSDVSTKGWQPTIELEVARAQHWLTAARCADEQVPPRQFDSSHSTDWRTDFWTHLPRPDEWSDESPYAPLNSFCSWTRTATYRLGQLGRCLDADIESTLTELEAAGRCLADELERYAINLPGAPRVHHLCLEVLLADVKAVKAALLARELVAKYSPAPFPLDEDDVHADKQANKQAAAAFRTSLETFSKLSGSSKKYKKPVVELSLLRKLERVNLAAFELLNPDQAARIETAQGELAETRKTLAAREKETAGAAVK